jgi:hypothetical protein
MKTYEDYSQSPDGWNVSATLELTDDGRFSYSEGWTDYTNASLSGGAGGTWRRGDGVIFFRAERVYPPMYFPWTVGQELIARLRDGALDFGRGRTLRPPSPRQEYTIKTHVSNASAEPLTLVLEPWGIRHTLAPGERVEVVAKGNWWEGKPTVERRGDEVVFDGRNGSWAAAVRPRRQSRSRSRLPLRERLLPGRLNLRLSCASRRRSGRQTGRRWLSRLPGRSSRARPRPSWPHSSAVG